MALFWTFMFFTLLSLVIGLTFLSKHVFYPYAIFLSAILIVFLTAFILFDKRIKAGLYMCLILSALFALNQLVTIYFLFLYPSSMLPLPQIQGPEQPLLFPAVTAALFLAWAIFLFTASLKSRPVFDIESKRDQINWLIHLKEEKPVDKKAVEQAKKKALENAT